MTHFEFFLGEDEKSTARMKTHPLRLQPIYQHTTYSRGNCNTFSYRIVIGNFTFVVFKVSGKPLGASKL